MRALAQLFAVITVSATTIAFADAPAVSPSRVQVCDSVGRYCAVSESGHGTTMYEVQRDGSRSAMWHIDKFVTIGFVSQNGPVLAVCYPGANLIPEDATLEFPLVWFFRDGKEFGELKLRDVYQNISQLRRTISHLDWGSCQGVYEGDVLGLQLNGRAVRVDLLTARLLP